MTPVLPTRQVRATAATQHQLAFSRAGTYVAVNPVLRGGATIHRTKNGRRAGTLSDDLWSLDFVGDDLLVATGWQTSTVWQLPTLEPIAQLDWSPDIESEEGIRGRYVESLGVFVLLGTTSLRCWDITKWKEVLRCIPWPGERYLNVFAEGGRLYGVSRTRPTSRKRAHLRELAVVDLQSGQRDVLKEIPYCVESFRFSHDASCAVICEVIDTGRYDIWDFKTRSVATSLSLDWKLGPEYSFSSACGYLAQTYTHYPHRSGVWIWNLNTGELMRHFEQLHPLVLCSAPLHPLFAAYIPSADEHEKTVFANPDTGEIIGAAGEHVLLTIVGHGFSSCGRWFGSVTNDYLDQGMASGTLLLSNIPQLPVLR